MVRATFMGEIFGAQPEKPSTEPQAATEDRHPQTEGQLSFKSRGQLPPGSGLLHMAIRHWDFNIFC